MPSNYAAIRDGILDTLSVLPGLLNVYAYEPDVLSDRLFYFTYAKGEVLPPAIAEMEIKWTWGGRLVVEYLTIEEAEPIITEMVPQILTEIFQNLSAQGAVADGVIEVTSAAGGFLVSQQIKFRAIEFVISCVEHFPFAYAL